MTVLSIVMPFYRNTSMLALQFDAWAAWSKRVHESVEIVLVDDCSPEPAIAVPRPDRLPPLSIYRVTEDRPWHQHAARNLGAHVAAGPWLLLTDMDHMLPESSAASLLKRIRMGSLDETTTYMLDRVEADTGAPTLGRDGTPKPHPNSFVLTREHFWRIGGYDEDYCGVYGTDGLFRSRAFKGGNRGHLKRIALQRYWRDIVADASTVGLPRKEGRDPGAKRAVMEAKAARGEAGVVKVLQFDWERVL